jgi:hypothetical protein
LDYALLKWSTTVLLSILFSGVSTTATGNFLGTLFVAASFYFRPPAALRLPLMQQIYYFPVQPLIFYRRLRSFGLFLVTFLPPFYLGFSWPNAACKWTLWNTQKKD